MPEWLDRLRAGRQRHGLAGYLRREAGRRFNRHFRPVRRDHLTAALRRVGLTAGTTVCVHSSLSRFGHIDGGAETVIDAILELVGARGTVLMPSFPTAAASHDFLKSGAVFDVRSSPSRVGLITETFRLRPDVRRSVHPTNPVAAWGRRAEEFLAGHEDSPTAYGPDTPYGRIAADPSSHVLMMETHIHSFLHHLQERVSFPGLFLDQRMSGTVVDHDGTRKTVETRVMRPRTPYFVAVPSARGEEPDWAILHDYALVFPPQRDALLLRAGYSFTGFPAIWDRRRALENRGALRVTKLRGASIGLLSVRGFLEYVEPEMRELIDRFRSHYDPERIAAMGLTYL